MSEKMHLTAKQPSLSGGRTATATIVFEASTRDEGTLSFTSAEDIFAEAQESCIGIPIILILGPPGCGKGTLSKRLAADYNLHHFSTGDWLRAQMLPPIAGVPDHINKCEEDIPPPLLLYNCSKRGVSTPSEMWLRALPALRDEFERVSKSTGSDRPTAILLDNFPKTITHARAAAEVFGAGFPSLAISITCSEEAARSRFVGRGRGSDDDGVFGRRYARSARETPPVLSYYGAMSSVVEIDAVGDAEEVYDDLVKALDGSPAWTEIIEQYSDSPQHAKVPHGEP
ncbi:hypothetical protein LTR85_006457 [Meristemomyces frigidus]|nr:hypothetical protein LTR85_006457 [Meristemomyces frigidus]